uniref:Actin cytoskeleton-regulatory complex protein PAN1 isoform X2 n=1 Tax=Drosophila rhopaloa TaxID=1041015 RepID=A0A6P4EAC7_DRORH
MVNVPPFLCSTPPPPPIDFGEDDDDDSGLQSTIHLDENDEYSNFGLVSGSKEPSPPPDPTEEFREKPPDLPENKQTAEAFNYQVKQAIDYDVYGETAPPTPPPLSLELEEEELEVPSLKLDSLSLYSTESVSTASTLSPTAKTEAVAPPVMQETKAHVLSHQVTLEDVSDESDEECSPKKPKELFIREGAVDFFAIEVLATPTLPNGGSYPEEEQLQQSPRKGKALEDTIQKEESFRSLENQEDCLNNLEKPLENIGKSLERPQNTEETFNHWGKTADSDTFQFQNFEATPKESAHKEIITENQDNEEDDDFGDFADFSAAGPESEVKETPTTASPAKSVIEAQSLTLQSTTETETVPVSIQSSHPEAADDGFDDFQEFATPTKGSPVQSEDDDDDFGDFSEPVVAPISVPPPPPPATIHLSIDEQVKPVLEMMFPQSKERETTSVDVRKPLAKCQRFNFGAIEHAQALDYQWSSSEMRHALVRSLGIDSRNILFGDKWNSSMPRFAANLSFDPLKPMKPLSTGATSILEPISNPSSYQESHVQTLQLEQLDQLTVVANADKINLVTSNSHTNNNYDNGDNDVAAPVDQLDDKPPVMDLTTNNNHNLTIDLHHSPPLTHFATICNNNNNNDNNNLNNNHANTATMTITINTNLTAHDALLDFSKFRWLCACVVVVSPPFSVRLVSVLYILLSSISLSTCTVHPDPQFPGSCYFGTKHPISASSVQAQVVETHPRSPFIFTFFLARYSSY